MSPLFPLRHRLRRVFDESFSAADIAEPLVSLMIALVSPPRNVPRCAVSVIGPLVEPLTWMVTWPVMPDVPAARVARERVQPQLTDYLVFNARHEVDHALRRFRQSLAPELR